MGKAAQVTLRGVTARYANATSNREVSFQKVDIKNGDEPEELGLDLLFYDNRSDVYWAPDSHDREVFIDKVKSHQLRTCTSFVSSEAFSRASRGSTPIGSFQR